MKHCCSDGCLLQPLTTYSETSSPAKPKIPITKKKKKRGGRGVNKRLRKPCFWYWSNKCSIRANSVWQFACYGANRFEKQVVWCLKSWCFRKWDGKNERWVQEVSISCEVNSLLSANRCDRATEHVHGNFRAPCKAIVYGVRRQRLPNDEWIFHFAYNVLQNVHTFPTQTEESISVPKQQLKATQDAPSAPGYRGLW